MIDKLINTALNEVGYLEKSKEAFKKYRVEVLYDKTKGAGSDNYTKYGYEMNKIYPKAMDFPAYWCDCFCDWCFYQTFGVSTAKGMLGDFDDYTRGSINLYKRKGAFWERNETTPQRGDQVFFSKNGTFSGVHHTGLVYKVEKGKIFTVEGNTSAGTQVIPNGGSVCKKEYSIGDVRIYGYGRPAYDKGEVYPRWINSNGKWYYRLAEGKNAHGWMVINSHKYYFNDKGEAITGDQVVEGKRYYFEVSGDLECSLLGELMERRF